MLYIVNVSSETIFDHGLDTEASCRFIVRVDENGGVECETVQLRNSSKPDVGGVIGPVTVIGSEDSCTYLIESLTIEGIHIKSFGRSSVELQLQVAFLIRSF